MKLSSTGKITRRVSSSAEAVVVTEVPDGPSFSCELVPPTDTPESADDSPRESPQWTLYTSVSFLRPQGGPLGPSDRVVVSTVEYEATSPPEAIFEGSRQSGTKVQVMPVTQLYPDKVDLAEMDDTILSVGIRVALWSSSEKATRSDEYEDFDGEAPCTLVDALKRNRVLLLSGKKYKIMTSRFELRVPHVTFTVRRAGG